MKRYQFTAVIMTGILWISTACTPIQTAAVPAAKIPTALSTPTLAAPPAWVTADFVDARNGKHFNISNYKGKVVLVDGMATWCPTCFKEARDLKKLHEIYSSRTDFVTVSLGLDLHEDAGVLTDYAQQFSFDWPFATAPLMVQREFGNTYGALFIDPTLVPMFIVDRQGHIYTLPLGYKPVESLKKVLDPFINAGS